MGYSFDYFIAEMVCERCGERSAKDISTNMQTKIFKTPRMYGYGINDCPELDDEEIEASGYCCVSKPESAASFQLLNSWDCPSCGKSFNWAIIKFVDSTIKSITECSLNAETISSVNYVVDDISYFGWKVINGVPSACPV